MANILFISVNDVNAHGIRMLSSCLKDKGHKTSILFLKRPGFPYFFEHEKYLREARKVKGYDWVGIDQDGKPFRYSRGPKITRIEKELLLSLIRKINPDIVGFSVTAPLTKRVAKISRFIKANFQIPIIWGGAGATTDPEGCLDHCDFVCVGEGEKVVLEIAEKIDNQENIRDVNNLCYTYNDRSAQNRLYPLISNLDELPFPDIDPYNKYLIEDDSLIEDFSEISYSNRYHIMGSRGCLFNCSYCSESYYKKLYPSERFLRRRSPLSIIKELKEARKVVNFQVVQFEDEIFSLEHDWLKEFKGLYKKEIDLPFTCYIYAIHNLDRQLELLKEAGLFDACLSLQSGSERINKEIFHRPFSQKKYLETARRLDSLGIRFYTDIITYNPFETEDDLKATLDILLQIPKPLTIFMNKLYILKNTTISQLAQSSQNRYKMNSVSNRLFAYYARLFWFSFTENRELVQFCQKVKVFKFSPFVLRSNLFVSKIRLLLKYLKRA